MFRLVAFLFTLSAIITACNADKRKVLASTKAEISPAYIENYDTAARTGDNAPNYDSVKARLQAPETEYDSFIQNYYISRYFWQKDNEIERNKKLFSAYKLPSDAKIIEAAHLRQSGISDRAIILWMTEVSVDIRPDEFYTCPDVTTGMGSFSGRVYLSLLNTKHQQIINTINVLSEMGWVNSDGTTSGTDYSAFVSIPFCIRNPEVASELAGLKYHATGGTDSTDGKAQVLYLDDYNGDGDKLEFALYEQMNCAYCGSILYGYSKKQDKLINYATHYMVYASLYENEKAIGDTVYAQIDDWVGQNYIYKADTGGNIVYAVDYRGRGGAFVRDSVHYNREKEIFEGAMDMRELPYDSTDNIPWFAPPQRLK